MCLDAAVLRGRDTSAPALFRPGIARPLLSGVLIDPGMFVTEPMHVEVETNAEFSYGRTLVDVDDVLHLPFNVDVAVQLDAPRFWDLLIGALATFRTGATGRSLA